MMYQRMNPAGSGFPIVGDTPTFSEAGPFHLAPDGATAWLPLCERALPAGRSFRTYPTVPPNSRICDDCQGKRSAAE